MPHLTRDGVKLCYDEAGAGPPMVFVRGWTCDRAHFAPQVAHFSPAHRCISIDLRGHGESDKPEQPYTIEGFADDVAWMCGELGVSRPCSPDTAWAARSCCRWRLGGPRCARLS